LHMCADFSGLVCMQVSACMLALLQQCMSGKVRSDGFDVWLRSRGTMCLT
jgi:hypothetical protein